MKIILNIIRFILMTLFTVCLIAFIIIKMFSLTVFNQEYVTQKFEEVNYCKGSFDIVKSNFENYIYQSGLDPVVLDNICTEEKTCADINIIISNIYNNENKEIDTTEIADKLNENIDKTGVRNSKNQSAIEKFVNIICNEYKETVLPKKYEKIIKEIFNKAINIMNKAYKYTLIGIFVSFILIILLNIKNIFRTMQNLGISLVATGIFNFILNRAIDAKIYIEKISIYNDMLSEVIIKASQDVLHKMISVGIYSLVIGVVLIIITSIILKDRINKKESIKEKTEYEKNRRRNMK